MKKKNLIIAVSLLLIAVISVGATLAFFSAQTAEVANVFTLGKVSATISEPAWNGDQKMMPGDTDLKDPKITIDAGSESAWVFIKVTITDAAALQAAVGAGDLRLTGIATNLAPGWTLMASYPAVAGDIATYVYGYTATVAALGSTSPIFTAITLPTSVDGSAVYTSLADGFTITAQGYAIQTANVATLTEAFVLATTQFGI